MNTSTNSDHYEIFIDEYDNVKLIPERKINTRTYSYHYEYLSCEFMM